MRYSISCRKKLSDIPSPNFWLHLSWKIRWTLYGRYTVKYVSASTTWNLVTLRVGVIDMEFGHNWGSGWHFLWWFSQKFHSSVIWTQRLCVFHFNPTFILFDNFFDRSGLKNLRFGESQIHRSRDHQQVEKPAIRWVFRDHQEFQMVQKLWTASVCFLWYTTRWFSFFCRSSSFVSICIPAVRGLFGCCYPASIWRYAS